MADYSRYVNCPICGSLTSYTRPTCGVCTDKKKRDEEYNRIKPMIERVLREHGLIGGGE